MKPAKHRRKFLVSYADQGGIVRYFKPISHATAVYRAPKPMPPALVGLWLTLSLGAIFYTAILFAFGP